VFFIKGKKYPLLDKIQKGKRFPSGLKSRRNLISLKTLNNNKKLMFLDDDDDDDDDDLQPF